MSVTLWLANVFAGRTRRSQQVHDRHEADNDEDQQPSVAHVAAEHNICLLDCIQTEIRSYTHLRDTVAETNREGAISGRHRNEHTTSDSGPAISLVNEST